MGLQKLATREMERPAEARPAEKELRPAEAEARPKCRQLSPGARVRVDGQGLGLGSWVEG